MRLKELNDAIAAACNVRANVVSQVQTETFRALRTALDKGEKIVIPDFGLFVVRDIPGEDGAPAKKIIRFKARSGEEVDKKDKKDKAARKANKAEGKAEAESDDE